MPALKKQGIGGDLQPVGPPEDFIGEAGREMPEGSALREGGVPVVGRGVPAEDEEDGRDLGVVSEVGDGEVVDAQVIWGGVVGVRGAGIVVEGEAMRLDRSGGIEIDDEEEQGKSPTRNGSFRVVVAGVVRHRGSASVAPSEAETACRGSVVMAEAGSRMGGGRYRWEEVTLMVKRRWRWCDERLESFRSAQRNRESSGVVGEVDVVGRRRATSEGGGGNGDEEGRGGGAADRDAAISRHGYLRA